MTKPLRSDATPMMRGAVYQLCVALERCYQLHPDQSLLVEELGDVSVPGEAQTEVKMYSSPLTSSHPNFWNTLYNWTEPASKSEEYRFLILQTSEEFGSRSRLANFNDTPADERMQLLVVIHDELELDFASRTERGKATKPSQTLLQQRALLVGDRKPLLEQLIGKIYIEARSASPTELYGQLCQDKGRHVLDSKISSYIDALLGFVCRRGMAPSERWEVSCEAFNAQVQTLTATYCRDSRQFPRAEFERAEQLEYEEPSEDLFVRKIVEVGGAGKVLLRAMRDYEGTTATISKEFGHYTAAASHFHAFRKEVINVFEDFHLSECLEPVHNEHTSLRFYLRTITSPPPAFPSYADSPRSFRNGILHIAMDDEEQGYAWKVVKL